MLLSVVSVSAITAKPSACSGNWISCFNAFTNNGKSAYTTAKSTLNKTIVFEGYNLEISDGKPKSLRIRTDFFASKPKTYISVKVSGDGGVTYGPEHKIRGTTSEKRYWIDITNDFPWTSSNLEKGKFKVSVTCFTLSAKSKCSLEWIPVKMDVETFDFSVKLNQTKLSIVQGQDAKILVNILSIGGISAPVQLSTTGCPSGVCSLSPSSGSPAFSSILNIKTTSSTPTGEYNVQVKASGDGKIRSAAFILNVLPETPDPDDFCKPLKSNNGFDNKINLVFVPSGFNGDMNLFKQKAQEAWNSMQDYEPYTESIDTLNAFYVSKEDGSYCNLNCQGIPRLLCCDTDIARSLSSECTSSSRQTIVLHNDPAYGGAGYRENDMATATTHSLSSQIVTHELGHSIFNLGDEYDNSYSNPDNSANCDVNLCSKWNSMLGYKGVDCSSNSCKGGNYYASETTIMRYFGFGFEEVNLRATCCVYYQETGSFPQYCPQFAQFSLNGNLAQYCSSQFSLAPTTVQMEAPFEYSLVKGKDGAWKINSISKLKPGKYPISQTGAIDTGVKLEVTSASGRKRLYFNDNIDVEYPEEKGKMGGYAKVPRKSISFVIDHAEKEPQRIIANGKTAYVKPNPLV